MSIIIRYNINNEAIDIKLFENVDVILFIFRKVNLYIKITLKNAIISQSFIWYWFSILCVYIITTGRSK